MKLLKNFLKITSEDTTLIVIVYGGHSYSECVFSGAALLIVS